jgi:hypothetical protein
MALGIEWVAKITTVALEMVLPGIFGQWLDGRWGTSFLGLLGFALGVTLGIWHLLRMTPQPKSRPPRDGQRRDSSGKPLP